MDKKQKEYLIENKWIVDVKGSQFIKFGGLLWLAKQLGLNGVETKPVLVDYDNLRFVYEATVTGDQGRYVIEGETNRANTNKKMVPYMRTLATTRSIVRALRLFCGVGMTSYEECDHDDNDITEPEPPQKKQQKKPVKKAKPVKFDATKYGPLVDFLEENKHMDFDKKKYDKEGLHTPMIYLSRYYRMKNNPRFYVENWTKEQTITFLIKLKEGTIKIDGLLVG
tara:strand:- start:330 stop:1001 length:672 start_codon:yes stop_codon:yes gene_type:complete